MSVRGGASIHVVGLFHDPGQAGQATYQLVDKGFPGRTISVMSSVPYPEGAFATGHIASPVPVFSAVGGIGGILLGLLFAAGTALLYPLPTGGKPVVALPTVGVITYEFTMLSAILLTVLGFLLLTRLPRRRSRFYDWRINDGEVAVVVPCRSEQRASVAEQTLTAAGAFDVSRRNGG